jgi:hypothetical protein
MGRRVKDGGRGSHCTACRPGDTNGGKGLLRYERPGGALPGKLDKARGSQRSPREVWASGVKGDQGRLLPGQLGEAKGIRGDLERPLPG